MSERAVVAGQILSPGERVPTSGVYLARHVMHRHPHEVLALAGEEFPSCRTCLSRVTFQLMRPVRHFAHEWDLAGPQLRLVDRRGKQR